MVKEKTEEQKQEIAFGIQVRLVSKKNDYIKNIINGRYFLARGNMIAVQIQNNKIIEEIDACHGSDLLSVLY